MLRKDPPDFEEVNYLIEAVYSLLYHVDGYELDKQLVWCALERMEFGRCECSEMARENGCVGR